MGLRRLMSVKEVATYLGITPSTCYGMIRKGVLVPVKIPRLERVLFDQEDIDRLIETSKTFKESEDGIKPS